VPFDSDPVETGVQLMVTVPGYGVLIRDVGRVVWDWSNPDEPEPTFYAGQWDGFDEGYQAICEALVP